MGKKHFLMPMLNAEFDNLAKKVMYSVFHYISVFLILSSFLLIMLGIRGSGCMFDPTLVVAFIGINYLFFAISQIIVALSARISLLKMFQWVFWLLISIFSFLGIYIMNF
jgi:hypothetical protein